MNDLHRYMNRINEADKFQKLSDEMNDEAYGEVWSTLQGCHGQEKALDLMEDLLIDVEWDDVVKNVLYAFQINAPETRHWKEFLTPFINKKIEELTEEKIEERLEGFEEDCDLRNT